MKNKVFVSLKGLQFVEVDDDNQDSDSVEVINVGNYRQVAGKDCVKYEEIFDDAASRCLNIIKFDDNRVEVTKKGVVSAHMAFQRNENTLTVYQTPYGSMSLGIFTKKLDITRSEDEIRVYIEYTLDVNYEHISDNIMEIKITSNMELA